MIPPGSDVAELWGLTEALGELEWPAGSFETLVTALRGSPSLAQIMRAALHLAKLDEAREAPRGEVVAIERRPS